MKKINFKTLVVLALILFSYGCADLDLPADGRLTYEQIFSYYPMTRTYYNSCRYYVPQFGLEYHVQTPLASYCDEAHDVTENMSGSAVNAWYNDRTSPFNNPLTYTFDWWGTMFMGIRKCNFFLEAIDDPTLTTAVIRDEEKNGWKAEVHVMRAFYYLQLIKRYGGVPLMETPYDVNYDFSQDKRSTFEECVDFIMADCDYALATPETSSAVIGFRWNISDTERGLFTRGAAWAIKSQAALFAASPLHYVSGSKYTWDYATTITKAALDECLMHGYELYNVPVGEGVAQNPYAYYFIQRSDPSRSVDKETIYESTASRTNVWRYAGTPITDGMERAGAGPSQELVDSYNMQATGEMPVLGYSDANHLQPILNPASGYDPANPYEGRDPRFYASIYYNNAPRALAGAVEKDLYPMENLREWGENNIDLIEEDGYFTYITTGGDPYYYTTSLGRPLEGGEIRQIAIEYKSNMDNNSAEFFFCVAGGPQGNVESFPGNFFMPKADDWTWAYFNLENAIRDFGFGVNNSGGAEPETHFLRFDISNFAGYELSVRTIRVEVYTNPPPPTPVETFVDGNCGISDRVTDLRNTHTGYYLRKFNNYRSNVNVDADGLMKIFRLGELYMNFAEAAYQSTGNPDAAVNSTVGGSAMSARDAVNAIRARAEMPPLPAGLSKEAFEVRYRNERRVEFAFEEHRFFDVRRWKILNETDKFVTGMLNNPFCLNIRQSEKGGHADSQR